VPAPLLCFDVRFRARASGRVGDVNPQRRTYYGVRWYIAWQLGRDRRRLAGQGYAIASQTWIPGVWFMPAVTMCLIVTYHHADDPTAPPDSELQRVIDLGQAGATTRRQFDRTMRQVAG